MSEKVNHPPHYQGKSLEVIDVIQDYNLDFCLGNAVKYILRAGKKHDRDEDLKKALWYIERSINTKKGESFPVACGEARPQSNHIKIAGGIGCIEVSKI